MFSACNMSMLAAIQSCSGIAVEAGVASDSCVRRYETAAIPVRFSVANAARLSGLVQLCSNASALDLLANAVDRAARSHAAQAAASRPAVSLLLYVGGGEWNHVHCVLARFDRMGEGQAAGHHGTDCDHERRRGGGDPGAVTPPVPSWS